MNVNVHQVMNGMPTEQNVFYQFLIVHLIMLILMQFSILRQINMNVIAMQGMSGMPQELHVYNQFRTVIHIIQIA